MSLAYPLDDGDESDPLDPRLNAFGQDATTADIFATANGGATDEGAEPPQDESAAMTDDEYIGFLDAEENDAIDYAMVTMVDERAQAIDYFFRQPFGNEETGRSQVVTSDVMDAVEGLMPGILEPFVSTDDVVKFNAVGEKDVTAAEQETDYVNHVVMQKNPGFAMIYKWVFDGLLQRNGIVKYYWDRVQRVQIERYEGLSLDQLTLIQQATDVEIVKGNSYPMPGWQPPPPDEQQQMPQQQPGMAPQQPGMPAPVPTAPMLYDVTLRHRKGYGCARVVNLAPEEFLISRDAVDANPKLARFCEHRRKMSLSDIRQNWPDLHIPDDLEDGNDALLDGSPERMARNRDDGALTSSALRGASREVLVREMYPLVDRDGDGIAERRMVLRVGDTILLDEEVEEAPFSGWTPYMIPHRYPGMSIADMTMSDQLIKSTLLRQTLDNVYSINNNRTAVSKKVDLDDLIDNPIGGLVRVDVEGGISDHIMPMPITPIGTVTLPMIEYMDSAREQRVGYTRYNQGLDADSLNKTATGVRTITQAGQERQKLISRVFAETGLKDLMISLHGLIRRNASQGETVKLRNTWVTVDPRNWITRDQMTVSVGLGTGDKQQLASQMMAIIQMQQQVAALGLSDAKKGFNSLGRWTQAIGFKDPHEFWNDPNSSEFQPPPHQDPVEVQVAKVQQQGKLAEIQGKTGETAQRLSLEDQQHARESDRDFALERYKAELAARTEIQKALIAVAGQALSGLLANSADPSTDGFDPGSFIASMEQILSSEGDESSKVLGVQNLIAGMRSAQPTNG